MTLDVVVANVHGKPVTLYGLMKEKRKKPSETIMVSLYHRQPNLILNQFAFYGCARAHVYYFHNTAIERDKEREK